MVNITVRGVPEEIHVKLKRRAAHNGNSVEAECLKIFEGIVDSEDDALPVRYGIAGRLRHLLGQVNSVKHYGTRLKATELALMLSHDDGGAVDSWISGNADQPFRELERIADLFSVNPDWLIHGHGSPFKVEEFDSFRSGQHAFERLMERQADKMALIRADRRTERGRDGDGYLAIVLSYGAFKTTVLSTPVTLVAHDQMSGGMENRLVRFVTMLRAFNRLQGMGRSCPMISSFSVGFESYLELIHGKICPPEFLRRHRPDSWWEDIWDWELMDRRGDAARPGAQDPYWPGFNRVRALAREYSGRDGLDSTSKWKDDRQWADTFDAWQWSNDFKARIAAERAAGAENAATQVDGAPP